eukprot:CAMPEP_0168314044 /NCGR_PEP_ID=MMETSP0210-20121227/5999_1 /TAXON_ID=40633 /ORGANISM="Condylostoma magnum, Strain COL2" /LENGTH=66 /DNA_ID=CAMNT_0008278111 /DNA_START=12037 /DNA_END=12237 /DNA_ORIENTATION=+
MDFTPLMEKASRLRQGGKAVTQEARAKSGSFGRASYDYAATGGEAFLTDAVDMVTSMFSSDKTAGK